jgi:hypothetical protein
MIVEDLQGKAWLLFYSHDSAVSSTFNTNLVEPASSYLSTIRKAVLRP